jgi:hypothetical protein
MNICTICGNKIDYCNPKSIKWDEKEGGACHVCVSKLRKTFGKTHEHFVDRKKK